MSERKGRAKYRQISLGIGDLVRHGFEAFEGRVKKGLRNCCTSLRVSGVRVSRAAMTGHLDRILLAEIGLIGSLGAFVHVLGVRANIGVGALMESH